MKEIMNRLKSPVVLASLVSAVLMVLVNQGIITLGPDAKQLIDVVASIVIGVGIFNNPADKEKW